MHLPSRRARRRLAAAALTVLATAAPLAAQTDRRPAEPKVQPRLVVLVVVDQLRPDYFARYDSQLSGGLGRFHRRGAVFDHGLQDHAVTETAPGHSTLLSGRFPAHTGIVLNDLGVPDAASPVLLAPTAPGASPRRFRGTALYDWLRAADSGARVLAVSRKDRGAILPVGRARAPVYWYADSMFTTSRWYADSLPGWVREWNARRGPQRLAGSEWTLLLPDTAYAEPDSMSYERGGRDIVFPHRIPDTVAVAARRMIYYPWMDSLTLDFALEGARRLELGRRDRPDLLVVSLSTTDRVGHEYGPDSRELHDQLLRLDRWLGGFMDSLAQLVPSERTLYVLSADHGVQSYPERRDAAVGRVTLAGLADTVGRELAARYGRSFDLHFDSGLLYADIAALRASRVPLDSLSSVLAERARGRPGIARILTPGDLARAGDGDVVAARWRRQLPPDFGWLLAAVTEPGVLWSSGTTTTDHGTPHTADVRVPIVFLGAGIRPGIHSREVRTVDIAPTLAVLLGLRPAERLDGRPLPEIVGMPGEAAR